MGQQSTRSTRTSCNRKGKQTPYFVFVCVFCVSCFESYEAYASRTRPAHLKFVDISFTNITIWQLTNKTTDQCFTLRQLQGEIRKNGKIFSKKSPKNSTPNNKSPSEQHPLGKKIRLFFENIWKKPNNNPFFLAKILRRCGDIIVRD